MGCGCADDLRDLAHSVKARRLTRPKEDDEWPGDWQVFTTSVSRLPSWINYEHSPPTTIRLHDGAQLWAFVHQGGTEEIKDSSYATVHDWILDYMETHQ